MDRMDEMDAMEVVPDMPSPIAEIQLPAWSLSLAPGEWVAVVGGEGAGKTKLLRRIAGLEPAGAGEIVVAGRDVGGLAPRERGIALVHANQVLYPHLTVYGNIAFGLKLAKLPRPEIDRRVRESARTLGLAGLLDRNPHGLTPALRPLVAIGRALARKPDLLLLDEPLGSLEGATRSELFALLKNLRGPLNIGVLYASRHQDEAEQLSQRVVTIDNGRLL
ncbi:MAG: ABC transporter ATP-binding protein [Candidatus Sumerlaeia bacterium]